LQSELYRRFVLAIIQAREDAGVTQTGLAKLIGRPQQFVWKVEKQERRLDVAEFCEIASALGQDPAALIRRVLDKA
jgi:transcriptional regulator with XRE-family HTH domain